jgi:predicted DNA-binding WGR domain protein
MSSINDVNRTARIDSEIWLDGIRGVSDYHGMTLYTFQLYCQRIDQHRNVARYYQLSVQPTLFNEVAVVRYWGRIGTKGGQMREFFANEREAARHFLELARQKKLRGYRPVGKLWKSSFFEISQRFSAVTTPNCVVQCRRTNNAEASTFHPAFGRRGVGADDVDVQLNSQWKYKATPGQFSVAINTLRVSGSVARWTSILFRPGLRPVAVTSACRDLKTYLVNNI